MSLGKLETINLCIVGMRSSASSDIYCIKKGNHVVIITGGFTQKGGWAYHLVIVYTTVKNQRQTNVPNKRYPIN
jgi:hypothetical protein